MEERYRIQGVSLIGMPQDEQKAYIEKTYGIQHDSRLDMGDLYLMNGHLGRVEETLFVVGGNVIASLDHQTRQFSV